MFLVEDCGQRLPLASGAPDLKAVAQSSSLLDTVALLKLIVVAAINCNDRIDYLTQMQEMDPTTMQVLIATAQEAEEEDQRPEDEQESNETPEPEQTRSRPVSRPTSKAGPKVDLDLESEERLGRVLADNHRIATEKKDVERQLHDAYARYEKLQDSLDRTQEELKEANDRLTAVLAGKGEGEAER